MKDFSPTKYLDDHYKEVAGTGVGFSVTPISVTPAPQDGSVFGASFRQENTIASVVGNMFSASNRDEQLDPNFDWVAHVPEGYQQFADRFVNAKSKNQVNDTRFKIDKELRDRAILGESPVSAFFTGFIANALDPTILLPGSIYYKSARAGMSASKAAMGASIAAAGSTLIQESALQASQETRTLTEGAFNILGASIIGSAMGAAGAKFINSKLGKEALDETTRVLDTGEIYPPQFKSNVTAKFSEGAIVDMVNAGSVGAAKVLNQAFEYGVGPDGKSAVILSEKALKGEGLKMGENMAKAFNTTIGNLTAYQRQLKSPFYWDRRIANDLFESPAELNKSQSNYGYQAKQQSVQTAIGVDMGRMDYLLTKYEEAYLKQRGIQSGVFKAERGKLAKVGLDADQFDDAVWDTMIDGVTHTEPEVNRMASMLKNDIFDPWKDKMIEIGAFPENIDISTAANYFMRVYNTNKIQDPRYRPEFENIVREDITETNQMIKAAQGEIKSFESKIAVFDKILKETKKNFKEKTQLERKLSAQEKALDARRPDLANKDLSLLDKQLIVERDKLASQLKTIEKRLFKNKKFVDSLEDFVTQENEKITFLQGKIDKEAAKRNEKVAKLNEKIKELRELREERLGRAREQGKSMETKNNIRASTRESIEKAKEKMKADKAFHNDRIKAEKAAIKKEREFMARARKEYFEFKNKENKRLAEKYNNPISKRLKELEKSLKGRDVSAAQKSLSMAQKAMKDAFPKKFYNSQGKIRKVLKDNHIETAVNDTVDNIIGLNDNRFDNPFLSKLGIGTDPSTSPIKTRAWQIEDKKIRNFMIRSPRDIIPKYARAVVPHYHLTKYAQQLGFEDKSQVLGGLLKQRQEEFKARVKAAGEDHKAVAKLREKFDAGERDIKAMVDMLMGIYGAGETVMGPGFKKFTRTALNYNYIRQMGYMAISSVSDPAFIVIKNGLYRSIHDGLQPILKGIETGKYNKQFLASMGRCIETFNGRRLKSFASTDGLAEATGFFGKTLDWMAQTFGNIAGMSRWNDLMQWIAGNTSLARTLQGIDTFAKTGKLSEKEMKRLSTLGISRGQFKKIHEQFQKHGGIDENGAYWVDWTKWDTSTESGLDSLNAIRRATLLDLDSTVVLPKSSDKPNFAQTDMGRLLIQYKSFPFAATSRILVPALQNPQKEVAEGIIMGLTLGAMGYVITSTLKNKEIDYSFDNLAFEAIDRFGILGILMEAPLTLQKMGVLPGSGTTRYQSRDWVGALGGPTLGALSDVTRAFNLIKESAAGEPMSTKEANTLLRLMPWNNVWYIDGINRNLGLTDKLAISLGAKESTQ